jgi:hypothetical protein
MTTEGSYRLPRPIPDGSPADVHQARLAGPAFTQTLSVNPMWTVRRIS